RGRSTRYDTGEGDALHPPRVTVVVVDRIVHGAAVVPQRERTGTPPEAARELRPALVLEEVPQQWPALLLGHAHEACGVRGVHVERPPPGLGVRAHHRVLGDVLALLAVAVLADAVLARLRDVREGRAVHRGQAREQSLHPGREGLVRRVHVRPHGVAARRWDLAGDEHRGHRRAVEVHGVAVPDAAEV